MTRNIRGLILELEDGFACQGMKSVARLTIRVRVSRRVRAALKLWGHVLILQARKSISPVRGGDMAEENLILTSR
jgi:hypothetical protein